MEKRNWRPTRRMCANSSGRFETLEFEHEWYRNFKQIRLLDAGRDYELKG